MNNLQKLLVTPWLYVAIITISIIIKISTVNTRYYWSDEIHTIHHTSGNSDITLEKNAPVNQIKNIAYFKQLLWLNDRDLTIGEQIYGQLKMPNLNPLHYFVLVFWHRLVGDQDFHYRLFSIFMFLLCLPLLFYFTKELFASKMAGWIAASLFSVSPYFHYFTLEARYNMLLAILIIALHYFLQRAIKESNRKYWIAYTIIGIMLLYSSLTAGIILLGHGFYILIWRSELSKTYILVGILIFLAYLPWLLALANFQNEISTSLAWHIDYKPLSKNDFYVLLFQLMSIGRVFMNFDTYYDWYAYFFSGHAQTMDILQIMSNILIILVFAYAVFTAFKTLDRKVFWFIIFIIAPMFVFFFTVDLIRGSMASTIDRYQLGGYLGIVILISYLLSKKISEGRRGIIFGYFLIVLGGMVSILKISTDREGLSIGINSKIVQTANFISTKEYSLVITDGTKPSLFWGEFVSLLHECDTDSIDVLYAKEDFKIPIEFTNDEKYSNIYALMFSDGLKDNLEAQFGKEMITVNNSNIIKTWELHVDN